MELRIAKVESACFNVESGQGYMLCSYPFCVFNDSNAPATTFHLQFISSMNGAGNI